MNLLIGTILFDNPALWIGAIALGIPVMIHLLTRRTPRDMVFPTLRFIRMAKANQSNIHRLRHIILLLLRTAMFLFILLAFLKPIITESSDLATQDPDAGKSIIILADASASMGYLNDGVTSFSRAKVAALEILDHCSAKDKINLIIMGSVPKLSFDAPSENLVITRKDIREAEVLPDHADINAALAEAVKQLGVDGAPPSIKKEIYFVSDFQRSNWSNVNFGIVNENVQMVFIPVGPEEASNCAIISVSVLPASPTVMEPVEIICKVANYGNRSSQVPLELVFKDDEILTQEITIEPHMTASTSFRVRINDSGLYECRLRIPGNTSLSAGDRLTAKDGLEIDNQRFFTFNVAQKVNVLLVSDAKTDDVKSGSRFLDRAINPFLESQDATVVTSVIRSDKLDALNAASAQVIILSEINELSLDKAEILINYLRDGGSIAYFHVGGASAHNLKLLTEASEGDYAAPYTLTGQVDLSIKNEHAVLAGANFDHRILRKFKETGELGDLKFYSYFTTERVKQKGQVLLSFDDGNVAMAEKTVGLGTMLLCNFGCSLESCDMPRHTLFVPLVHEIIKGLRPSADARNSFEVGHQCSMTTESVTQKDHVEFRDPDDTVIEGTLDVSSSGAFIFFPRTHKCGFYRIFVKNSPVGSVAVNVNALESNLEALDISQLKELAKISRAQFYAALGNQSSISELLSGKHLWHYFLLIAIVLLALEQVTVMILKR
ncbi:MAG: BatA domain-containing protein [Sedimentisphaerales bacterium]|nr:BatA domain-containing protein [Sedimentisphaerales bacterium]